MNDRYLYRAKRTDNGEWVEGFLVTRSYPDTGEVLEAHIIVDAYEQYGVMNFGMTPVLISPVDGDCCFRVDKNTICQCAGLKNKNGKLIWENDICRRILLPTKRIKTIFRIAYVSYKCCLSAIDLDGSNVTFLSDYINNQYEVEVIGNIFDNPELLEAGE